MAWQENSDNSYHVVTGSGVDATAILDGFTITAGNADGDTWPQWDGGGIYTTDASPTLAAITFAGNAADHGGGLYNNNSEPELTNCAFLGNSANVHGGGMYNYASSPTLVNVTFSGNTAPYGGGMYNDDSSPTLANVTFNGNTATDGGGMYNSSSNPELAERDLQRQHGHRWRRDVQRQ